MKKVMWFALCLMFVPSLAFAANTPVADALGGVVEVVAYTLALTLATLITMAVKWLATKYKLQVPATWMESVNVYLDKGINYAEEWAKQKLKTNETVNGSDKLNTAVSFIMSMVDDKKLIAMGEDKIRKLIEARLGETRMYIVQPMAEVKEAEKN